MGDKVEQTAEAIDESTINQAGRDINNHYGPKMYEIIQTIDYQVSRQFESLLHKHAPALIQNEMRKVEASVNNFKETMSSRLSEQFEMLKNSLGEESAGEQLVKGVTDSNFQYLFKDSLEQVIRKKDQAPQDVLVELLLDKVRSDTNSNYLVDEAIEVLKYLNKNHVNFLIFTGILRRELSVTFNVSKDILEHLKISTLFQIRWTLDYLLQFDISEIDLEYLSYKGLILDDKIYIENQDIYDAICMKCIPEDLKNELNKSNEELIELLIPELSIILEKFGLPKPYTFNVLSKVANTIIDKSYIKIFMSIQNHKELSLDTRNKWNMSFINMINQNNIKWRPD
ncbi:LPO_1073/Vpar_1526 family protein [Acinetobacter baumannii]|uniref:LPO_1073/Vpar_1526 family protein n=1 Tax=Acinetobacter baumannii TaxID=470 RepID=UPI0038B5BCB4